MKQLLGRYLSFPHPFGLHELCSIDFKTDTKIQAAVRAEFANSCLLTIAHRIRTVIDYDRLVSR
jgi:ABC-type transport system involved in Fe-S cluster assembly fused permease/ATPase subunit